MSVRRLESFAQRQRVFEIVRAGGKFFPSVDAQRIRRKPDEHELNRAALHPLEDVLSNQKTLAQVLIRRRKIDALNVGQILEVQPACNKFVARRERMRVAVFDSLQIFRPRRAEGFNPTEVDDIFFGHAARRQKIFHLAERVNVTRPAANQPQKILPDCNELIDRAERSQLNFELVVDFD